MQDYRKLLVWEKAHAVASMVHQLSTEIPRHGNSGLIGQMRRAALSIPANIAEGSSRPSRKDFAKFIQIAIGSASELEYHLQFALTTDQIRADRHAAVQPKIVEVRRMLFGLLKRLRTADSFPTPNPPSSPLKPDD
jgi:four helix bundle protein